MKIGDFDTNEKVIIIAEIGNNHEGHLERAHEMIAEAAQAGADAVKFQTIVPELLVSKDQKDRLATLKRFQFNMDQFAELAESARRQGVIFLSTPFDLESARKLESMVPAYKIASGDNTFFPLLKTVAETGKPIIISSGLTTLKELIDIKRFIDKVWSANQIEGEMAILHCVSSYPADDTELNLRSLSALKMLDVIIGYSDHSLGTDAAILSVALGARIIEKHFTLDRHLSDFRDHQLSADPEMFSNMVERIRQAEMMLGRGKKAPTRSEEENIEAIRRSIAAKRDLEMGAVLSMDDLCWVRPGTGFSPGSEKEIIGKSTNRPICRGEIISADMFLKKEVHR